MKTRDTLGSRLIRRASNCSRCLTQMMVALVMLTGSAFAQHVITTSPGPNGNIFPTGPITVPDGAKPVFFIIPNANYSIAEVKLDAASLGKVSQVHLPEVHGALTVSATFVASPTITATASGPGTISPSGADTVGNGGDRTFKMAATVGSMLSALTVNNVAVTLPNPKPSNFTYTVTNITVKTTIKATFAVDPTKAILTSSTSAGGTIVPLGKVEVLKGNSQTYTVTPASGYYLASVKVDGKVITAPYTVSNVQAAHSILATFAKNPVITAIQSVGGTVSPSGASSVTYGSSKFYSFTPLAGYAVTSIIANGKKLPAASSYTFPSVTASGTIKAVFGPLSTHVFVTSSAGAGGSISPLGKVGVLKGANQSFSISTSSGYRILDVKVDGKSVGTGSFQTLTNVQKAQTIAATFIKNPIITAKQATGGTVTPASPVSVSLNGSYTSFITPQTGYEIANLVVDGKSMPAASSYGFSSITTNHTISAVFRQRSDYVVVTATAGAGGTISPAGKVLVMKGTNRSFTATPALNYRVLDVKVGTVSQGAAGTATITNIQANATVTATFTKLPTITATQATGGKIVPASIQVVPLGGTQNYIINPDVGYKLDSLLIDGKVVADTDGSYDFTNVTANHKISAKFSQTSHIVEASSAGAGTIVPSGTLSVFNGKDQSFTVTPPAGFKAGIKVNGIIKAQKPGGGPLVYVLKNVRKNYTVEAIYAPVGSQFAGTLGIAPIGLGDTIHVANKTPATFNLLTNGTLGVSGVYFHNMSATKWGQATAGTAEDNWVANVPLIPGDNNIWFAAVGTGGEVAWYPTVVTYYPSSDFTTPLSPYKAGVPLSTLVVGQATVVTWKLGLLSPAGAAVTLYRVADDDSLTQVGVLADNGVLPDEIQGDGLFTGNITITAATSSHLHYRAGVVKPGPVTYYSETVDVWAPPPLTDAQVNSAAQKANDAKTAYEARITAGDTEQEAAEFVADQMRQDPAIGFVGTTEEGGLWWITAEGILGGYHPRFADSKAGGGAGGAPVAERGEPPPVSTPAQAQNAAQNPFYSPHDWATMFPDSPPPEVGSLLHAAATPPLSLDGKNRIRSDRALIISPYINNPVDSPNFGNSDDFFGPWVSIQNHKTCGLYADKAYVNNGSVGVSIDNFKNLSAYGYIHFSTHGDNLYNGLLSNWQDVWGPNDFLKGNLSLVGMYTGLKLATDASGKFVKGIYEDDINQKRIAIFSDGAIFMLPSFFQHYVGGLPNSLVSLSACRSGYNGSLMSVFLAKGAGAVMGYTNYVKSSYAKNMGTEIVDRMYEDKSLLQAMQSAVGKYTNNDGGKPAYFVYMGATDLYFPNASLTNGGFEDGIISPWESSGDGRVITGLGIERPKEGKFMGIISTGLGFTTSSGSIQQRVCVPDAGGLLGFRWSMYSEEWLEYVGSQYQDSFTVSVAIVDPTSGAVGAFTPLFGQTVDSLAGQVYPADVGFDKGGVYKTGWRSEILSLGSYSGKTIVLKFSCSDVGDSIYDSAVLLDQIEFLPAITLPN